MYDYQFQDDDFAVWVLVHQTWRAMRKSEERVLAKIGLSPEQNELLWVAANHPGPLTAAEICRALFRESNTISQLLNRMERGGLVTRAPKRKGRPFTEVKTTGKGQELYNQAKETNLAHMKKIISCLSAEEIQQLKNLLKKIRENALKEILLELHVELRAAPDWSRV